MYISKENGKTYILTYIYICIHTHTFTYVVGNFKVIESFVMDYIKYVLGKCS